MINYNITNQYGANLTVLMPGVCNSKCSFCFWNHEEGKIKPPADYFKKVQSIIEELPENLFSVLSISGGEPSISPYLKEFLSLLKDIRTSRKFKRVVLTTNGYGILNFIDQIPGAVDHINISRHHYDDFDNDLIFGNKSSVPNSTQLKTIIQEIHRKTFCDVTLNCVHPSNVTVDFCKEFISYAKEIKADAVAFRKEASTVTPTKTEKYFVDKHGKVGETQCPVCRGVKQNVNGFEVRWKGSVKEPSVDTNGIYELIIHPDGKLYADWDMKHLIDIPRLKAENNIIDLDDFVGSMRSMSSMSVPHVTSHTTSRRTRPVVSSGTSGCGNGGVVAGCGTGFFSGYSSGVSCGSSSGC